MCKYCERRTDVKFGWEQPKLPWHNNMPFGMDVCGNMINSEKVNGVIHDYKSTTPMLIITDKTFFGENDDGCGTLQIPIKYCPECGRKLGKENKEVSTQSNTLVKEKAKAFNKIAALYEDVSIFDEDGTDARIFTSKVCDILCEVEDLEKSIKK